MRYRRAGRWGLELSVIGVGSWTAAAPGDDEIDDILQVAYDLGVRVFDTANFYEDGAREVAVGKALAAYPRESFVLNTKVSFPIGPPPNNQGLSRKHIVEQCEASLRRLGTDHIDIYQCHRFEPDTPLEETCRAMDDLVRAGKIVYWGVTSWPAQGIRDAVALCESRGWAPPISDQEQYSALWREPEAEVWPACRDAGMAGLVWSPLAMGVLAGRYRTLDDLPEGSRATKSEGKWMQGFLNQPVFDAVDEGRKLAAEAGLTVAQLSLAWVLHQPPIHSVAVGASSPAQLRETLAAADLDLEPELVARFGALFEPVRVT